VLADFTDMLIKDIAFPVVGLLIGYGVIKMLSKPYD